MLDFSYWTIVRAHIVVKLFKEEEKAKKKKKNEKKKKKKKKLK